MAFPMLGLVPSSPARSISTTSTKSSTDPAVTLSHGTPMLKISSKKIKQVVVKLQNGTISWTSRRGTQVAITSIRELRLGQPPSSLYASPRWITIVYVRSGQWKVLHLIALTDDVYDAWVKTLRTVVAETSDRLIADLEPTDPDMVWIRQLWPNGSTTLDPDQARALCKQIGLEIPDGQVGGCIDIDYFWQLIRDAQRRPEVDALHAALSGGSALDRARVDVFLRETQKLDPAEIFDQFAEDGIWAPESLIRFLKSSANASDRPMDLDQPLQHYYISSSHNSYLVGEQWRGESSVEGYIRILLAKCRCVEIDVHDGEVEPVVYHKMSLTSRASLRDICQAINKYAFVTSPLPVIVSCEVRCSVEQQERLAAIAREIWTDKLVSCAPDGWDELPSPNQLRYKILFKAKLPSPKIGSALDPQNVASDSVSSSTESDSNLSRFTRRISFRSDHAEQHGFAPSLADLLVYTKGVPYQGFSKLHTYAPNEQFSVSERTANRIIKETKADWVKHNLTHLSRVYPKGPTRLMSTNFDPVPYWSAGCQLVAMNWQTLDHGAILNHAMFDQTQGYVLKPLALRQKVLEAATAYKLDVRVISGQRLPLAPDLHVEVSVMDQTSRTQPLRGQAMNPLWNEHHPFKLTATPSSLSYTFLRIEIKNTKTMLARWIRPLADLPRGYRHLPLYDQLFTKFVFATLFVRIDLEEL